jgi:hypothetical protein
MRCLLALTALSVSFAFSDDSTAVVARAGDIRITAREFLDRFTLEPWRGRRDTESIESTKVDFARSLVAEKLLAREARQRGLHLDSSVSSALHDVRKMLSRDQLYLNEVRNRVAVTDDDIDAHLKDAAFDRSVVFLVFARGGDAADVRSRLSTVADLESLRIPHGARVQRDSVVMVWGSAQPALQDAAWQLKPGEISNVVRTPLAFYIVGVKELKRNPTFLGKNLPSRRKHVADILRRRGEQETAARRGTEMLSTKLGKSLPDAFDLLDRTLRAYIASDTSKPSRTIDLMAREQILGTLGPHAGDTLTIAGGHSWTIGDALDFLVTRRFTVNQVQVPLLPRMVNGQLREMVEQELLSDEGLSRRLDTTATVKYRLGMWSDAVLASRLRAELSRGTEATSAEIWAYARERDSLTGVPEVKVREIRTRTRPEMQQALDALHEGMPFDEVVRRWTIDTSARARGGVIDFFPATEREPVGPIAVEMRIGELMGPLSSADGFVSFELLDRRTVRPAGTPRDSVPSEEIRREVELRKARRRIDRELIRLRNESGVSVDEKVLRTLSAPPFPMVTYQTIGFGGRMLAVPVVPAEYLWWGEGAQGEVKP